MTEESDRPQDDSFDLDQFERLVRLMDEHDLREVRLSKGGQKWSLKRGAEPVAFAAVPAAPVPQAAQQPAAAPAPQAAPAAESAAPAATGRTIDSPAVGTFYSRPDPADPPFVSPGSKVEASTVVCLLEAMKVYNQIQAETSGTIKKVLVNDGDAVEFGQPLFELE